MDALEQRQIAGHRAYRLSMAGRPKDVGEVIASTIKRVRKARGLTQTALGKRAGLTQTTISAIERCAASPAADTLQAIAGVLNVEAWQLQIDCWDDDVVFTETLPDLLDHYRKMSPADREALQVLAARLAKAK